MTALAWGLLLLLLLLQRGGRGWCQEWGPWACSSDGETATRFRSRVECTGAGSGCLYYQQNETAEGERGRLDSSLRADFPPATRPPAIHVQWTEWTAWSPECGGGEGLLQQSRTRCCSLPPPGSPLCSSTCGSQNRTAASSRTVPAIPCCQGEAVDPSTPLPSLHVPPSPRTAQEWRQWSAWSPSCQELLCEGCEWGGREGGVGSLEQNRTRGRAGCEGCPECDSDRETRNGEGCTMDGSHCWQALLAATAGSLVHLCSVGASMGGVGRVGGNRV